MSTAHACASRASSARVDGPLLTQSLQLPPTTQPYSCPLPPTSPVPPEHPGALRLTPNRFDWPTSEPAMSLRSVPTDLPRPSRSIRASPDLTDVPCPRASQPVLPRLADWPDPIPAGQHAPTHLIPTYPCIPPTSLIPSTAPAKAASPPLQAKPLRADLPCRDMPLTHQPMRLPVYSSHPIESSRTDFPQRVYTELVPRQNCPSHTVSPPPRTAPFRPTSHIEPSRIHFRSCLPPPTFHSRPA